MRRSVPVQNLNRLPVPAKRMVLIQNFLRTTEHVSDLLGRLWFMRPSFEKFADASRLLALPWYFDVTLIYNYLIMVIPGIRLGRILGSGSCKTSCTKLKKVKNFTRATPLRSKTPNIVQRDIQIRVALCSSFGPKLIWTATGAPPRPNSEILPHHNVRRTNESEF